MGQRYLYLVRHGQYDMDSASATYGQLTAIGREQVRRVAKQLTNYPMTVVHHSDMVRAEQSARIIQEAFPRIKRKPSDLLREGIPGMLGEPVTADHRRTRARMDRAYRKYFRSSRADRHEVLVCHGNIIRYLVLRALDLDTSMWLRMDTHLSGVTVLRVDHTFGPMLSTFNDQQHLPNRLRLFL